MEEHGNVAIFWDLENCRPGSNVTGYEAVGNIRSMAQTFGSVRLFKAYLEVSQQASSTLRGELQASGVSLTDCPSNGRKPVADKMLIVDMIAYIIDNPAPATLVLVSGDRDYAYAISILRLRRYRVVVICPPGTHSSLTAQASVHLDWDSEVLGQAPSGNIPSSTIPIHQSMPPSRKRADSTASRAYIPSASKSRYALNQEDDDEDDLYLQYDAYRPPSTRVNGPDDFASSRFPYIPDVPSGRPTSAAPSRTYTFQSAKSSPPTPPLEYKTPEPTFGSSGGGFYGRSFTPTLPKGFPFSEPEPISLKSAEAGPSTSSVFQRASTFDTAAQLPSEQFTTAPLRPRSTSLYGVFTPASMTTAPLNSAPSFASPPTPAPPPAQTSAPAAPTVKAAQPVAPPLVPAPALAPTSTVAQPPTAVTDPEPKPVPARTLTPTPAPPAASASGPTPAPPPTALTSNSVPTPAIAPTPAPARNPTPAPVPVPKTAVPVPAAPRPAASVPLNKSSGSSVPLPSPNIPPMPVLAHFKPLVARLQARQKAENQTQIRFTDIANDLHKHSGLYAQAGVSKFGKYIALATTAGIVDTGGFGNNQWISLRPGYA